VILIIPVSFHIKFNFAVGAKLKCLTSRKILEIKGNEELLKLKNQEAKNQRNNTKVQWSKKKYKN
jgi:hypothetical protein